MKLERFEDLVGLTLSGVERVHAYGNEELHFRLDDGRTAKLFHSQDCCENVFIEDIAGDLNDLVGSPIIQADESSSDDRDGDSAECPPHECEDSTFTWTFYRIATEKGLVVIRWYGSSNGYYSESVDFYCE